MKKLSLKLFLYLATLAVAFSSCSDSNSDSYTYPESQSVGKADSYSTVKGFYLVNEGNFGNNNSTLSFYDATSGAFYKSIFSYFNPTVTYELGDTSNDIQIYDGKAYIVMTGSNQIIVLDTKTNKQLATIAILAPRHIAFSGGFAYVTSTSNLAEASDEEYGALAKINLSTNTVESYLPMSYGPEGLAIRDNKVYVANSQYFNGTTYQSTYSNEVIVVNIANGAFEETTRLEVAINLTSMLYDSTSGNIYVVSAGDYVANPSKLGVISKTDDISIIDHPVSSIAVYNGTLYGYAANGSYVNDVYTTTYTYFNINTATNTYVEEDFLDAEKLKEIKVAYNIAINPETGDFYITDAKDYSSPGAIYCFDKNGDYKWSSVTGINPAGIAFSSYAISF